MVMDAPIALPLSRKIIREVTKQLRKMVRMEDEFYFPVIHFLEWWLPLMDQSFELIVLTKEEMGDCYGQACPEKRSIYLREDVYDGALENNGRDRFTVAHEIGHYFLHRPENIRYARMENNLTVPAYRNPEWQANTFAAELLMPHHLIQGRDYQAVARECAVSYQAAKIQLSK